ncbi:MAG: class I mannose-6-phosphate isomerase [Firmicutes bacterium]|nr:class I mannose-6-phosphate isomerase [Bacillota bacterium]
MLHEYIWGTEDWIYEDEHLLIKRIDARDKLSVQVHPDDVYAKAHGLENGKTECWYITECEDGAFLYCGMEKGLSEDELRRCLEDGSIESHLTKVCVHPGDFIFIPAGTVHAIGAGIKLIEVQQNSKTTYRLYDYKRLGPDGKERELHIDSALECIDSEADCGRFPLPFSCEYFGISRTGDHLTVTYKDTLLEIPLK